MSINQYKSEKIINFPDGSSLKAKMSMNTMMEIESAIGCSLLKLGRRIQQEELTIEQTIILIELSVRGGGNDVDSKLIRQKLSKMQYAQIIALAGELVALALNVNSDEELSDEKKNIT